MVFLLYLSSLTFLSSCLHFANEDIEENPGYFYPRTDFLQRFEPRGNRILFGTNASNTLLSATTISTRTQPVYFSFSFTLGELRSDWYMPLQDFLARQNHYSLLQIDLHILNPNGQCYAQAISDGFLNEQLDGLGFGLRQIGHPTMLRFAPEFNAIWSTCEPHKYQNAWRRLGEVIRHRWNLEHVALVWTSSGEGHSQIMEYFPGNEYVDWWSLEIHTPKELRNKTTDTVLYLASENGYPILLGASTPLSSTPKTSEQLWFMWFKPLFSFLQKQPLIKAFTYNDWIELDTSGDPIVAEQFHLELSDPIYQLADKYEPLKWLLDLETP
ncbi:MAG: hypothetical protein VX294_01435 [Candidatus Latescibacterota bacterium]|nr:hypothetical protein [Candidatus Latescibacterota bacterium]